MMRVIRIKWEQSDVELICTNGDEFDSLMTESKRWFEAGIAHHHSPVLITFESMSEDELKNHLETE